MVMTSYIEIELGNESNSNILFGPVGQVLRGRWSPASPSLRGMTSSVGMNQMPALPGMCIGLDTETKTMIIRDPLGDPENASLVEQANSVLSNVFSVTSKPADKVETPCDEDMFKTVLFWMRRLIDAGNARSVVGSVPTLDEIRSSVKGKIRKFFWDTGATAETAYEEDTSVAQKAPAKKAALATEREA